MLLRMIHWILLGLALSLLWAGGAFAWEAVGRTGLFVNDFLGDGRDRWRAVSWQVGLLAMPVAPAAAAPGSPLAPDLLETRLFGQVLLPTNLKTAPEGDRPMAGAVSLGAHGYWLGERQALQLGLDLVMVGEQTGYLTLLEWLHGGDRNPSDSVRDDQVANGFYPTFQAVYSGRIDLGHRVWLHPFAQGIAGVESLARVGLDVMVGPAAAGALPIRDEVTGFLMPASSVTADGWALSFGADAAKVFSSHYLPEDQGYELTDARLRARGGLLMRLGPFQGFYGLTWLGEEFEAQPEGQLTGAIHFNFRF